MEHRYDINDFYMIEHVCSRCGNICAKTDDRCVTLRDHDEGIRMSRNRFVIHIKI